MGEVRTESRPVDCSKNPSGVQCCRTCAGLTAILLVIGVMDLRAMVVVAVAITAERLAPQGQRVAWAIGAVSIVLGVYLMGRGAWLL